MHGRPTRSPGLAVFPAGRADPFAPRVPRIFPELRLAHLTSWRGRRRVPFLSDLRQFAPGMAGVVMTVLVVFVIFQAGNRNSVGFRVNLHGPSRTTAASAWPETLGVYVDGRRGFHVNGEPVGARDLGDKLRAELGKRVVWVVYLEADKDCLYMDLTYAIDTIEGLGATLVWITPQMRKELDRAAPSWHPAAR